MSVSALATGVSSAAANTQMNNNYMPSSNYAPKSLDTTSYFQQQTLTG